MPLELVLGPDPIFRKKAETVTLFDEELGKTAQAMLEALYREQGLGLGANMLGLLQRIIVVDLQEGGTKAPMILVNPAVTEKSAETQTFTEASLSFPGLSAEITRPRSVTVTFQDINGESHSISADGWLATILQHEIDYLDGILYFDYLSATKRNMLLRKAKKLKKSG
ncbi:peptide deformylase [Aestuariispira insulae]|uniref:Peptide deformylase-like n=1 Tax=Aestuariispira insulae TaxID=1461337 RepID=A0A3D9HVN9_9PROT|nr:peptide deformylase [Aestuariispira insulae]RED53475.1 peptide deformylase [Aestuariispira insulae]